MEIDSRAHAAPKCTYLRPSLGLPEKKDKDRRKGKGRRFSLGGRIFSIPIAALAVLPWTILNNRMNCTLHKDDLKEKKELILLFKIVKGKIASAARN